jgi:hypothetical protein
VGGGEYRLLADAAAGCYRIRRAEDARLLAVDTPGLDATSAQVVALRLEHIARWASAVRLTNPATELAHDAVRLEVYREHGNGELELLDASSGLRLAYQQVDGTWRRPQVQIRLHNTTQDQRLFCMLLDLTESYSVYAGLLPKGGVWLDPGQEAWATVLVRGRLRKTIDVYIPDQMFSDFLAALQAAGLPPEPLQLRDLLKLIVSTDEADATLMQQGELPVTAVSAGMRSIPRLSTLNRLMARVHTRNIGLAPASDEAFADWTTAEAGITVVRPAEALVVR